MKNTEIDYELIYKKAIQIEGISFKEWEILKEIVDRAFDIELNKAEYTVRITDTTLERITKAKLDN
ncbi:MAG: hypothetical protein K2I82_02590 [Ruminococcus sp.]|nr:hypothetical protein [Ruminococcus sp.]